MPKAIFFDFDGVLADTEPLHLKMFQQVLATEGLTLTTKDYYKNYLGYDDATCFKVFYRDQGRKLSPATRQRLMRRKTQALKKYLRQHNTLIPGARRVVKNLAAHYPLAIVSGALKSEIRLILKRAALSRYFKVLIAAEDVKKGKPHPEGYLKAWQLMKGLTRLPRAGLKGLKTEECMVVEDSHWGIEAAHRAGMKCIAIATSYPKSQLKAADLVLNSLSQLTLTRLRCFERPHVRTSKRRHA